MEAIIMRRARLQPAADDTWRIEYDEASRGTSFEQMLHKAAEQHSEGDFRGACDTRFAAFQELADLIPEDESVAFDWNDRPSRSAIELLYGSALDHFLVSDWEMAAAMLEMLLDLDPEDHLDATRLSAYCYVALGEWELFEEALADLPERSGEHALLSLYAAWQREGELPPSLVADLRDGHVDIYNEFTAADHPADEAFLNDIESERPSRSAQARELWLQTEHVWEAFPEFLEKLKRGSSPV